MNSRHTSRAKDEGFAELYREAKAAGRIGRDVFEHAGGGISTPPPSERAITKTNRPSDERSYRTKEQTPTPLGATFDPRKDSVRLARQYERVVEAMRDGAWRTLAWLSAAANCPEASASARLRDMRRGGWVVEHRRVPGGNGLFEYRARRDREAL